MPIFPGNPEVEQAVDISGFPSPAGEHPYGGTSYGGFRSLTAAASWSSQWIDGLRDVATAANMIGLTQVARLDFQIRI